MKPLTLSDDRRAALAGHLQRLFAEEFDEDLDDEELGDDLE